MVVTKGMAISILLRLLAELVTGYLWNRSHAASYTDVSLSMRAKESGEGENGETSLDPLRFVASHTRITRTRAFRARLLCAKNEGPEEEAGPQNSLGFWIPRSGFRISGTLSVELGFRIPVVRGIPDSLSCNPDCKVQDSGLHKQEFPGFWIP